MYGRWFSHVSTIGRANPITRRAMLFGLFCQQEFVMEYRLCRSTVDIVPIVVMHDFLMKNGC